MQFKVNFQNILYSSTWPQDGIVHPPAEFTGPFDYADYISKVE